MNSEGEQTLSGRLLKWWGNLPHHWIQQGAKWIGLAWYALDRRHRRIAEANIRLALGYSPEQSRALAKANFIHLTQVVLETTRLPRVDRSNYHSFVEVQGTQYLEESLKLGKGIIFLTAHLGNWEWMSYCSAFFLPSPPNVIARPLEPPWLNRLVCQFREKSGNKVIARKNATQPILRSLARNEIVAILFDHNAKRRMAISAPFFGVEVPTNRGLALIAIKSGAQVHPAFNWREPSGKFHMQAYPALSIPSEGPLDERIAKATALFNQSIEKQIRSHPAQWFWVYRRFASVLSRPEGRRVLTGSFV